MIYLSLVHNIALLVSLTIFHGLIVRRWRQGATIYRIISGLLFGIVAMIGIMTPLRLMPGVIFDGRSIVLSVAGLFGGPLTAAIAAILCVGYRLWLGGQGAVMGVSVIIESASIGVVFHYLRSRYPKTMRPLPLWGFGILVHLGMLTLTLTLPGTISHEVLHQMALPVLLVYPLASLLICLVFLDQESRITAEESLRKSEEQYRQLVENANSIILKMDNLGNVTFFNEFAQKFFGFSLPDILNRNVVGTIVPATDSSGKDLAAMIADIVNHPLRYSRNENENMRRNGERVWIAWTNKSIRDHAGHVHGVLCIGNDITERKHMEAQLRQAQKMEAVGQLAGGVAHDFNNILAAILMHLGMLRQSEYLTPEVRSSLEVLDTEVRRAANLTRQLLLFSRRQALQVKPLDLNHVLADLVKMLRRLLGEHIELVFQGSGTPMWMEGDAGMMEQVVMNLAVNARDAMPKGGRLIIATRPVQLDGHSASKNVEARAGSFVCLTVSDTGCGMDAAILQRMFEPFFTTKEVGQGTGLGLSTVHGIVKQHQGWIEVESVPGNGSTFRVFLPTLTRSVTVDAASIAAKVRGGNETILLVEDEPSVRSVATQCLRRYGYHVLEAANGREAEQQWFQRQGRVDLLFTDMVMPEGMTGLELASRLKQTNVTLKVILSSGYNLEMTTPGWNQTQGFVCLAKPFDVETLAATVRKCLDQA